MYDVNDKSCMHAVISFTVTTLVLVQYMCIKLLKGHSHRFSRIFLFFTMHNYCISGHKTKMPVSYDKLKERYKPQMLYNIVYARIDSPISLHVFNAA